MDVVGTVNSGAGSERHCVPRKATSLPVGFLGLFIATTGYAALQLHWIESSYSTAIALSVLAITVPVQLLACAASFAQAQTTAGTAMGILAGTWAAVSTITITTGSSTANSALGVVLLCAGCAMLVPAVGGTGPPIAPIVMSVSAMRFIVTGVAEITAAPAWLTAAGWVGLGLAGVSFYAALAVMAHAAHSSLRLPLGATKGSPR